MKVPFPIRAFPALAFKAWLTPPPMSPSSASRDREALANLEPCYFGGVPGHEVGTGPVVVAAHGWGGRAAQMAPIAQRLAVDGYRVVVPQLPGHAGGLPTDIKQAAAALQSVIEDVGEPEAIVAHSFGAMVLRLALVDQAPPRVVLVAPALDVRDALEVFGDKLGLLPWARRGLRRRLEAWDRSLWPTVADVQSGQLSGAAILIVHDPSDGETPFPRSAELAALRPETSVVALPESGHSRILADPDALDTIVDFVSRGPVIKDSAA